MVPEIQTVKSYVRYKTTQTTAKTTSDNTAGDYARMIGLLGILTIGLPWVMLTLLVLFLALLAYKYRPAKETIAPLLIKIREKRGYHSRLKVNDYQTKKPVILKYN